tara:strand:+ start:191 stop:394 length:204 start_codon:yes stop_codon:yes gene_type:complete
MKDLISEQKMKNVIIDSSGRKCSSPPPRPILIRQNATWDKESEEKERRRVNKVLKEMGVSEQYYRKK